MNKTWFTSDHHFFHEKIIHHCKRPFAGQSDMNDWMITQWNSVVAPRDRVIHLGDLFWGKDTQSKRAVRNQLNGRICLVPGNHDRPQLMLAEGLIDEVLGQIHSESFEDSKGEKHLLVLCHYPMQEWDQFFRGSIHLHGHCHGNVPGQVTLSGSIKRLDVSVDNYDFKPLCVDDVLRILGNN
jgi:calcineurin-like phosphoesterase family protein